MQKIGVLDCNNFFVSCERLFRPDLKNKPVVVLSSNDGCVVARSQEIKDSGIAMGVPHFQIKDNLKDIGATTFSSNFALYRDISQRVFDVVKSELGSIEQYSIDECFFAVQDNSFETILNLKRQVERKVGIPISIGVGCSKTQAKYIIRYAKKTNGIAVLNDEKWSEQANEIRLSEIWGVGTNRSRHFSSYGIVTVADLCNKPESQIKNLFGIEGARLQAELMGRSVLKVTPVRLSQKSITSSRSFASSVSDLSVLEDAVAYHVYQVANDLKNMNLLTNSLRLTLGTGRYGDFALQGANSEITFNSPTADIFLLNIEAKKLLKKCYKQGVPYKKVGILLGDLKSNEITQSSLFNNGDLASDELSKLLFNINAKHKKTVMQLGRVENKKMSWIGRKQSLSPRYTTIWSDLKIVRTQ